MQLKSTLLLTTCFLIITLVNAQSSYKGILYSKLGQQFEGEITIKLKGSNTELIEVTNKEKRKQKGSRETITTSNKLNSALVSHILIEGKTYYLRDIKVGYDDKKLNNVCVQLILGTVDCGIFQYGEGTDTHSIAVKFPKAPLSELSSVDFDYYKTSASIPIQIFSCKPLFQKMKEKEETVTWTESSTREQRIERFKNIITAYNGCASNN
jgi:hypothetical protein